MQTSNHMSVENKKIHVVKEITITLEKKVTLITPNYTTYEMRYSRMHWRNSDSCALDVAHFHFHSFIHSFNECVVLVRVTMNTITNLFIILELKPTKFAAANSGQHWPNVLQYQVKMVFKNSPRCTSILNDQRAAIKVKKTHKVKAVYIKRGR